MAKQIISRGSSANDGTGDNLREGANKINLNFTEVYTAIGDGTTIDGTIKIADDSSTVLTLSANGETMRLLGGTGITTTISSNDLTLALDTSLVLTAAGTTTLTNKSIDLTDNTLTGTLAEINTAVTDATLVSTTGSESLTNKDLTGSGNTFPTITMIDDSSTTDAVSLGENFRFTGGTGISSTLGSNAVTFAIDNTVATLTGSQTLTNKTIDLTDNTLSGTLAEINTAVSDATLVDTAVSTALDSTTSGNKLRFNFANTGSFPTAATYEGMFAYDIGGNKAYVADAGGWVKLIDENASIADLANVGSIASITNNPVLKWNSSAGRFDPGDAGGFSAGTDLDQAGADIQDIGYIGHRSPDATVTQTLAVTVVTKTSEHTAFGDGSSSGYAIDGHEGPHLQLSRGVYKFDLENSSSSHPFRLYEDEGKNIAYTTGVTTSGSGGSSGDHLTLTIDDNTVTPLFYQCSAHPNMGGRIDILGGKRRRLNITTDKSNTGDGSDTTFTILANRTVDDILVFVNGICLVPTDDYTISGTTLTFATAPANTAEIVIRYLG